MRNHEDFPTGPASDLDQRPADDRQGITDVRVCDETGNPCGRGCEGACWYRAVGLTTGHPPTPPKQKDTCPDSGKPCTHGHACEFGRCDIKAQSAAMHETNKQIAARLDALATTSKDYRACATTHTKCERGCAPFERCKNLRPAPPIAPPITTITDNNPPRDTTDDESVVDLLLGYVRSAVNRRPFTLSDAKRARVYLLAIIREIEATTPTAPGERP